MGTIKDFLMFGLSVVELFLIAGAVVAVLTFGWTLVLSIKRDASDQIDAIKARVCVVEARQEECRKAYESLKDELHTNYPRANALAELRNEMRAEFANIGRDFDKVFDRLSELQKNMAHYSALTDAHVASGQ